jgi:Flp pilus assembly protein TadD
MVVDPRHDHSFRIPRPDLSMSIGVPNACNGCHEDLPAKWAAEIVAKWYGTGIRKEPHYGRALDAGRRAKTGAVRALAALSRDASQPAIVRATALELISRYPGRSTLQVLRRGLRDADPMVRHAAVVGQELLMPAQRIEGLAPLLEDPVRAVRVEAARQLAPVAVSLPAERRETFDRALAEFEAVQMENADRPEALASLANLYLSRGEVVRAERMYRSAIALDAGFVPAYANLADLYRAGRRDRDAERVLREGLRTTPDAAALHEALGLVLVRQGKRKKALSEFAAAVKTAPNNTRHTYIYAVALHDAGRRDEAIRLLEAAAERRGDRDVLLALAAFKQEAGDSAGAERSLRELAAINPDDPALAASEGGR